MAPFAVYLIQHPDCAGPSGFVGIDADRIVDAITDVGRLAKAYDAANSTKTTIAFALPRAQAEFARNGEGFLERVRSPESVFGATLAQPDISKQRA